MRAEIVAVGTELLMGETVNTNATWISKALAELGIDVFYHSVVGDNPERLTQTILQATERSNVIIFTGGLGPTDDDLTIETLAKAFSTPMVSDPVSEERIRNYFITRDTPMSPKNIKQALRPETAVAITNPIGTAPGLFWDLSSFLGKPTMALAFPGVPKELYAMWPTGIEYIQDLQRAHGLTPQVLVSTSLNFFGIGESKLAEILSDLMQGSSPTVAPYVGRAEVRIRVSAKGNTRKEAFAAIEPVKQEIIARCGDYYVSEGELPMEHVVGQLLRDKKRTVSTAESCTGGLVSSRLTDVPGSSAYTRLNVVTYSNEEKTRILGVSSDTLAQCGAVSPNVAKEMVLGLKAFTKTDYAIALTGIAGPDGGTEEKPVGLVYIAVLGPDEEHPTVKRVLVNRHYGRADIKHWFSQYALHFLRLHLIKGALVSD